MNWFKEFFSVLGGTSGTTGQRFLYIACIVLVVALIILLIVLKAKRKSKWRKALQAAMRGEAPYPTTGKGYIWKDRRRIIFGLPWTFERYRLMREKLLLVNGFISTKEEEVKLYRVLDFSLSRSLGQRIFGLGTVTIKSNDKSLPVVVLKNIKQSKAVKELISDLVEKERLAKKVGSSEMMGIHDHPVDLDGDGIPDMPPSQHDL